MPRAYHAAAYDFARERMVVFGGYKMNYTALSATWEFDGTSWTQTAPSVSPGPRGRHAMVYDLARDKIVLFGGTQLVYGVSSLDDTWEFDGSVWVQGTPTLSPLARFDHAMAYDMMRGKTVLFGGRENLNKLHGDTWEWDGSVWTQHGLGADLGPRYRHAMSYDLMRGRTVLFGGRDVQAYDDTWEWDGFDWLQAAPATSPSARDGHKMAYDLSRNVTVMCGGILGGTETWEYDGTDWVQHGAMPGPRADHGMVYDARLQRMTVHGGTTAVPGAFSQEVHTYGHRISGTFQSLGSGCAGSNGTPTLSYPVSGPGPMMGATTSVHVTGVWYQTFFVFGWSDLFDGSTLLPYDLAPYGMPGCSLQVSRDEGGSAMPNNGIATIQIPVPENPFLVGQVFFVQGFALDLAANAGGFTTTNRVRASIGRN